MARLFLIILLCLVQSCSYGTVYKGKPKHRQPDVSVLPEPDLYFPERPLPARLAEKLGHRIRALSEEQEITGISAAVVVPGQGAGQAFAGVLSRSQNLPVDSSTLFYWASTGKLVTATVIMQLVQEKKISLGDKLAGWYPDFQEASAITVEHLLTHTSGLYSFNSDTTFHMSNRYYSPQELLAIARARRNHFPAGQHWAYSNTGYLLLALIAEKIEGKPFDRIVAERIAAPLNLTTFRALKPKEAPLNLAPGHLNGRPVKRDRSIPLGAGNIVSNARDMALFLSALLSGNLVPKIMVHEMLGDLYPMYDAGTYYGKGIMLFDFSEINGSDGVWIGHSGGTEDYKAVAVYDTGTQIVVAVAINENKPAEAVAYDLVQMILKMQNGNP